MANSDGKLLFGIETEYGLSATDLENETFDPHFALNAFLEICADTLVHLPGLDSAARMYLANGSLLYPDVGHPEYATAECTSPEALLMALRAGERILTRAAGELDRRQNFERVRLFRTNVDYAAIDTTWGCHESYFSRTAPRSYAMQVVPHLVSRIVYTGAGGFNNRQRGATFVLSPRVFHLNGAIDPERNGGRAIFSVRDEPLGDGRHHRTHLLCGECNYSDLSNYLKIGATALVLAMADAGVRLVSDDGRNRFPMEAMRRYANDPSCRKLALEHDGRPRTAIELQRRYLEAAETHADAPFMPDWAPEVLMKWRATLDDLEADPDRLIGRLDWPTKLALCKEFVRTHSQLRWESLPMWSEVATQLAKAMTSDDDPWPRVNAHQAALLSNTKGDMGRLLKRLTRMIEDRGYAWRDLDAFQQLRDQLCELDLRYGQLYPRGIFLDLEAADEIRDRIVAPQEVHAAIDRAPNEGRARLRGEWVRRLAGEAEQYTCKWTTISGRRGHLDLRDPFVTEADWQERATSPVRRLPGGIVIAGDAARSADGS